MAVNPDLLPAARIVEGVRDFLLMQTEATDIFGQNIFGYRRLDNPTRSLPALSIYKVSETLQGQLYNLVGELNLEAVIPPVWKRMDVTTQSSYISNVLFMLLNANDVTTFLGAYSSGGIQELAINLRWDMGEAGALDTDAKKDAYRVKGTINYNINLLNFYENVESVTGIYENTDIDITPVEEVING